jgi:inosine-uridine nucleoside N-ribohydrolase
MTQALLIDTDPGIDDAMALCFLGSARDIGIRAITTVFGNASAAVTTANAALLCARFGIRAPIHPGADSPLLRPRGASPVHVHGEDGLGDIGVDRSRLSSVSSLPAAAAIVEFANAAAGELRILALGPLTNLALALDVDPSIAGKISDVVIMGGAFGWYGRRGNVTPFAEANIHNDPHAAARVLAAPWRVTMVGLDVTSRCVLPAAESARLAATCGAPARFLHDISRGYELLYREQDGLEGCCLHDVAAAAYVIAPEIFTTRRGRISVVTEGAQAGMTSQDDDGFALHRACLDVTPAAVLRLYAQMLFLAGQDT